MKLESLHASKTDDFNDCGGHFISVTGSLSFFFSCELSQVGKPKRKNCTQTSREREKKKESARKKSFLQRMARQFPSGTRQNIRYCQFKVLSLPFPGKREENRNVVSALKWHFKSWFTRDTYETETSFERFRTVFLGNGLHSLFAETDRTGTA